MRKQLTVDVSEEVYSEMRKWSSQEDIGLFVRLAIMGHINKCKFAHFAPDSMYHTLEEYENRLLDFLENEEQYVKEVTPLATIVIKKGTAPKVHPPPIGLQINKTGKGK